MNYLMIEDNKDIFYFEGNTYTQNACKFDNALKRSVTENSLLTTLFI